MLWIIRGKRTSYLKFICCPDFYKMESKTSVDFDSSGSFWKWNRTWYRTRERESARLFLHHQQQQ